MQYLGGKFRTAKYIVPFLQKALDDSGLPYVEPFVGGCNILPNVKSVQGRMAGDINEPLVNMYEALATGWIPPDTIDEAKYAELKALQDKADPLMAFAGFGCSFSGKWFGGYARSGSRNYAKNCKNVLLKLVPKIQGVRWYSGSFFDLSLYRRSLIYCDPPYANTTQYDFCGGFNHTQFYDKCRELRKEGHFVFVSEYAMPDDFVEVLSIETKTDIRTKTGKSTRTEKIFTLI